MVMGKLVDEINFFFFLNNDIANKIYNFLLIKKTYLIKDF